MTGLNVGDTNVTTLQELLSADLTGYTVQTDRGYHLNPVEYIRAQILCGIEYADDFQEVTYDEQ